MLEAEIKLRREVQKAMGEIKQLRGLLPICAWCKKVRNDTGLWEQVELYVRSHSDAEFTHSVCPDCRSKVLDRR
jgi:DNA-directed RNA polymerase subunit RPC12/RpoP